MTDKLIITNLAAGTKDGKSILKGISLTINKGEIHAVMGPNGGGKSTLAQVLMGHPDYVVTEGSISLNDVDITHISPDKRAKLGLFLGFQYPVEVTGVHFGNFLRMAMNEQLEAKNTEQDIKTKKISPIAFRNLLTERAATLALTDDLAKRFLNQGFSGGEKKKAEILQLTLLKPSFAILDEPDSGLDVDALRYIGRAIRDLDFAMGLLLITHYQRILQYIKPHFVHIVVDGKIVKSGDSSLAKETEEQGYERYL